MSKEDVIKKIKKIMAKNKEFDGAKIKINFINKGKNTNEAKH